MANCIFHHAWECPYDGDEIPLEVCRLCVDVKLRIQNERMNFIPRKREIRRSQGTPLSELNRKFTRGEITVDEYIEARKLIHQNTFK